MKKLILSFFMAIPAMVFAQPTLQAFSPVFGITINVHDISNPIPSGYPTSGNHIWDFSQASLQPLFSISLVDPSTTPYINDFPSANFAQTINSGPTPVAYFYGVISPDSLYGLGARSTMIPTANLTYLNPNVSFRFPMNYQDQISDVSIDDMGDTEIDQRTYAGWGSVITPFGTYNDVVLLVDREFDSLVVYSLTKYVWASSVNLNTIIEIDSSDGSGSVYEIPVISSIPSAKIQEKNNYSIQPNPVQDQHFSIRFSGQTNSNLEIKVFSTDGRECQVPMTKSQFQGGTEFTLNTSSINKGIYLVKINMNNEIRIEKIVVE